MIDRRALVSAHDVTFKRCDYEAPLELGNGSFAVSLDVTGFQGLYKEYEAAGVPLCIMGEKFWNSYPATPAESAPLVYTGYSHDGRPVSYPVRAAAGNEQVYNYLRQNPHKFSLCRIALAVDGRRLTSSAELEAVSQRLHLWGGTVSSSFRAHGRKVSAETWVAPRSDTVCYTLSSEAELTVILSFGFPSHKISGFEASDGTATLTLLDSHTAKREVPGTAYFVTVEGGEIVSAGEDELVIKPGGQLGITFSKDAPVRGFCSKQECEAFWNAYWEKGGMIDFSECRDTRAFELERRVILSQYLTRVNSTGMYPPAETGLYCNSWYGKFHLEMVPLHVLHFALFSRSYCYTPMLDWYKAIMPKARENAARNGYKGVRWPKMTDPSGNDSPSKIAPLLLWQQPHILFLLEYAYEDTHDVAMLKSFKELICETADFMVDAVTYERAADRYSLTPPLIPVQEVFAPETTYNPSFECSYWKEGLECACRLMSRIGEPAPESWRRVAGRMAKPAVSDGLYMSCESNPDSFTAYARDHPSMLFPLGYLEGRDIDPAIMLRTLKKALSVWDYSTLWGWDFAFMAMCAARLRQKELALELLLKDTAKNYYAANGCNLQKGRGDLPAYFPGNGSLLLAVALMCTHDGFPTGDKWLVRFEDIKRLR